MENTELSQKRSKKVSLFLLIPALLFGIISLTLAMVGLGLIPLLPAIVGAILVIVSLLLFGKSYKLFAQIVTGILLVAALLSVFRGVIIKKKVANDIKFDSTMVKSQEGIDHDLKDAFGDNSGTEGKKDTVIAK
jgi:Mn2+/Fe2+ NRAMP family transporter